MPRPPQSNSRRGRRASWGLIALTFLATTGIWKFVTSPPKSATRAAAADTARVQYVNPDTSFEPSDWNVAPVAIIYIGILVLLTIACLALKAGYPDALPDVARAPRISPPGPRLVTNARSEFQRVRTGEEAQLNTYYWIDRQEGVVHIPIEQAMQKVAGKGILGFPKGVQ